MKSTPGSWIRVDSADAQPWIPTFGKRPDLPDGTLVHTLYKGGGTSLSVRPDGIPVEERRWEMKGLVIGYRLARWQSNAGCTRSHPHENMNAECERKTEIAEMAHAAAVARSAAAPVWRPCTRKPPDRVIYNVRHASLPPFWQLKWDGEYWCGAEGARSLYQDVEWLDPAPGHEEQRCGCGDSSDPRYVHRIGAPCYQREEQVNAAQEVAGCASASTGSTSTRKGVPVIAPPAAAPAIEQDRQAFRKWLGRFESPPKLFGSRD